MERLHETSNSPAQPAPGARASSVAQRVSENRTVDTEPSGGASGSAARPATLLEQVEQFVRNPKRCWKKPTTDNEGPDEMWARNQRPQALWPWSPPRLLGRAGDESERPHVETLPEEHLRPEDVLNYEELVELRKWKASRVL